VSDEQGEHEDESPLAHPVHAAEEEVEHLVEVADEGESPATPAILGVGLIAVLIPIVAILIGASFLTAYLVTRDDDSSKSTPTTTTTTGGAANGKALFSENCASCHTLADADANGTVGPNLDDVQPSKSVVVRQVTDGGGGMPAFGDRLSTAQIAAIAGYVARVAGQ
jgi:mono/diheme cytochrome c family protein